MFLNLYFVCLIQNCFLDFLPTLIWRSLCVSLDEQQICYFLIELCFVRLSPLFTTEMILPNLT